MRSARYVAAGIGWLFVASIVVQVFLAGVGIFGAGSLDGHRGFGYLIPLIALVMLVAAAVARVKGTVALAAGVLVLAVIQTMLPYAREAGVPYVAALHPVNAFLLGLLGIVVARRATSAARETDRTAAAHMDPEPASRGA